MNVHLKAWDCLGKAVLAESYDKSQKAYTAWAESYEKDLGNLGLASNELSTKKSMKYIANKKDSKLLDVASGTGLCGAHFVEIGYKGILDALDHNEAMLKVSKTKNVYRKHIQCAVLPDTPLPVKDDSYDTVVCSGGFHINHLDQGCVVPMIRCLKPGGILIFNSRKNEYMSKYLTRLDEIIQDLIRSKKIEEVEVSEILHYRNVQQCTDKAMKMLLFVYRKI